MDSIDLARHLLALSKEKPNDIFIDSNTKLNKLLYIIYGIYLAIEGKAILTEKPKCFAYGPIFPRVFEKYTELTPLEVVIKDDVLNDAIETTIKYCGNWPARQLAMWSYQKKSPWYKVYDNDQNNFGKPLDDNDIREYFNNMIIKE